MKSLDELKALRDKAKANMSIREGTSESTRVVVGMATCGIAAGARPILSTLAREVADEKLEGVVVGQTGCIGICMYEPVVEVFAPGKPKVTYVKMTPEKAMDVVRRHLKGGQVIAEYTIGAEA